MPYIPWEQAWREALYGPSGFFRRPAGPAAHFRTASTSSVLARALARLATDVDRALGEPDGFAFVDVGAGRGELLERLAAFAPERWRLLGVDIVDRPAGLADRIDWALTPPADVTGVVLAHELLDALPCPVVECDGFGVRLVLVNPATGKERLGPDVDAADAEWLRRWWNILDEGLRAEVGRPRDDAWRALAGSVTAGVALAVDYAHSMDDRSLLPQGTLAAYADGLRVPPVPDGSCDLTAHVALDACAAATPDGGWTLLTRQADLLPALGVTAALPGSDARSDPRTYALQLSTAAESRTLLDPAGPGGFGWLLHGRGLPGMMRP
jgi:SAM-dependent MidA family methyltransferase